MNFEHRTSNIERRTPNAGPPAREGIRRSAFDVRRSMFPAPSRAAFTLMEVLLAIAVCAAVLVAVSALLFSTLRLRARTATSLDEALPLERALNLLRRDLKNAVPPSGILAGPLQSGGLGSSGLDLTGATGIGVTEQGGLQIYTATGLLTADLPWGDIQKVVYHLQPSANSSAVGKELVRSVTRNLLPTSTEESDDQWLAGGIESLQFRYFDGANWVDSWDAGTLTNLPAAVRVSLQPAARDGGTPPPPFELLVPLVTQMRTNAVVNTGGQNVE